MRKPAARMAWVGWMSAAIFASGGLFTFSLEARDWQGMILDLLMALLCATSAMAEVLRR